MAMWRNTRLVVLTAMSASLYAALLIPFKVLPLIPGVTELRPANAVPVVCSFLFGPAAAWGAAIGNLIGDFFGGIGPGDLFGFAGNFLYGLMPYKAWRALSDGDPLPRSLPAVGRVRRRRALSAARLRPGRSAGASTSSASCRSRCSANIIFFNNFVMAVGAVAAAAARRSIRASSGRACATTTSRRQRAAPRACGSGSAWPRWSPGRWAGCVVGNLLSTGQLELAALATSPPGTRAAQVGAGVAPFIALVLDRRAAAREARMRLRAAC